MKKFYSIFIALFVVTSLFSQNKKLVFVGSLCTNGEKDAQVIDAIKAHGGYDVTTIEMDVADESILPQCNAADVVIIGRSINSSDFGTSMAVWDQITKPAICLNMYGMRNLAAKGYWVNNVNCENISTPAPTDVLRVDVLVDDPVFDGSGGSQDWWLGPYAAFIAEADGNDAGNGTLMAQTSDGRPMFIRWNAGVEFYPGAGHSPQGIRTFIGCGQDKTSTTVGYWTWSSYGEKVFYNELARMAALGSNTDVKQTIINKSNAIAVDGGIQLNANSNASIFTLSGKVIAKNVVSDFVSCQKGVYMVSVDNSVWKVIVTN